MDGGSGVAAEKLKGEDQGCAENSLEGGSIQEHFHDEDRPGKQGGDVGLRMIEPDDVEAAEHEGNCAQKPWPAAQAVAAGENPCAQAGREKFQRRGDGPAPTGHKQEME